MPVAILTQILNERDGEPHRYWRVITNYPSFRSGVDQLAGHARRRFRGHR